MQTLEMAWNMVKNRKKKLKLFIFLFANKKLILTKKFINKKNLKQKKINLKVYFISIFLFLVQKFLEGLINQMAIHSSTHLHPHPPHQEVEQLLLASPVLSHLWGGGGVCEGRGCGKRGGGGRKGVGEELGTSQ